MFRVRFEHMTSSLQAEDTNHYTTRIAYKVVHFLDVLNIFELFRNSDAKYGRRTVNQN